MEEWTSVIPIIAFLLIFAAFLYFSWRAIRMSKRKREHMSNLPLEEEETIPARKDTEKDSPSESR